MAVVLRYYTILMISRVRQHIVTFQLDKLPCFPEKHDETTQDFYAL